jgi:trans-2,3-dihydro-3-hydroxyanthranilate isomerase
MTTSFFIVDVFAEQKYAGNQLAVFRGAGHFTTEQMQTLAREMHFSETTFILSDRPREGGYDVRIFTVDNELPFAGHPTLGTAFVIRNELLAGNADTVTLNLGVGQIPVTFGSDGVIWMQQQPPTFGATLDAGAVTGAIGLNAADSDPRFPVQIVSTGVPYIIVPLKTREAIRRALPNGERFRELEAKFGLREIFLFCPEPYSSDNHLNARMFFGKSVIAEDPATGSANGCLTAYLTKHRYFGSSTVDVRVEQGYEIHRPSLLYLRGSEQDGVVDVRVGGKVFKVASGTLED